MKTSTTIALALAALLSGSLGAYAQTEQPTPYHHYHVHHHHGLHHHHNPAQVPQPAAAAAATEVHRAAPFGLSWPHIAPYPDNRGDEDGLSEDSDDCNKGCIDGGPN